MKGLPLKRTTKRVLIAIAGTLLLVVGVVMLITPGPGLLLLAGGLAVWATEFEWAARAKDRLAAWTKRRYGKLRGREAQLLGGEDSDDENPSGEASPALSRGAGAAPECADAPPDRSDAEPTDANERP